MPVRSRSLEVISPAKINLTLAILNRRPDGFHALHSIVSQTGLVDRMLIEYDPEMTSADDHVEIRGATLDKETSVHLAVRKFRQASGYNTGAFRIVLEKRIPVGAGLGGGSSNAVAALRGIQQLLGEDCGQLDWSAIAASIGSDCPLFLLDSPVIMEGRGEILTELDPGLSGRLRGEKLILFKPQFSINTGEAYRRLAAGSYYSPESLAAEILDSWRQSDARVPRPWNDFERLVQDWLPSLAVVLDRLRHLHGFDVRMSGSGSACFAFPGNNSSAIDLIRKELESAWGDQFWIMETTMK